MNTQKKNPVFKVILLITALITFVIGLSFASTFSFGFGSKYVTLALILLAVWFVVSRFRKGSCCS